MTARRGQGTTRTLLVLEELESRNLLSAGLAGSVAGTAAFQFDLVIKGTQVGYSPLGLPAFMAGNIYLKNLPSGPVIGQYQENLVPQLALTPAGPELVGTTGVATFTFAVNPVYPVETIQTADVSMVEGQVAATGALEVASTGTITQSAGAFSQLQGGFTSASLVSLFPTFSLATAVHFSVSEPLAPSLDPLALLASPNAAAILQTVGVNPLVNNSAGQGTPALPTGATGLAFNIPANPLSNLYSGVLNRAAQDFNKPDDVLSGLETLVLLELAKLSPPAATPSNPTPPPADGPVDYGPQVFTDDGGSEADFSQEVP